MGLPDRSDPEVRRSLARMVALRWPWERLLFTTDCRTERLAGRGEWLLNRLGRMHCPGGQCGLDTTRHEGTAIVGVTQSRIVYRERARSGFLLRLAAGLVAAAALIALVVGNGVPGFLYLGAFALVLWATAHAADMFGSFSGAVEFERIREIDQRAQRIEGTGRWGTRYRLRIPDPSDFRTLVGLASRGGAPSAA